ncbi:MAG: DsbE family thiol:disulfide interchange protein [Burkholderiales bacterium]
MNRRRFIALALCGVTAAFLGAGLTLDPRELPSPLIGKQAPPFELPALAAPDKRISADAFEGQVWILNVWASWCVSCREEHAALTALARSSAAPVIGLNYKDERAQALAWLGRFGDPYTLSLHDHEGRLGIDYGVYGVPETFVIDRKGVIRYKRVGILTPEIVRDRILPLVKELQRA